jgi:signal transduction histidine kinase
MMRSRRSLDRWPYLLVAGSAAVLAVLASLWVGAEIGRERTRRRGEDRDRVEQAATVVRTELARLEGDLLRAATASPAQVQALLVSRFETASPLADTVVIGEGDRVVFPVWVEAESKLGDAAGAGPDEAALRAVRTRALAGAPAAEVEAGYQRLIAEEEPPTADVARLALAGFLARQGRAAEAARQARLLAADEAARIEDRLLAAGLRARIAADAERKVAQAAALDLVRLADGRAPPLARRLLIDELRTVAVADADVSTDAEATGATGPADTAWLETIAAEEAAITMRERNCRDLLARRPSLAISPDLPPGQVTYTEGERLCGATRTAAGQTMFFAGSRRRLIDHLQALLPGGSVAVKISEGESATSANVTLPLPPPLSERSLVLVAATPGAGGLGPLPVALIALMTAALGGLGLGLRSVWRAEARARELAEARRDLIAGVSHELRTPLAVLRMYSDLLGGDVEPDSPAAGRVRTLHAETVRMCGLVENLLALGHLDRRRVEPALLPLDVTAIAREAIDLARPLAERAGCLIDAPPDDTGTRIVGVADRGLVMQILMNLIDNALKYGRPAEERPAGPPGAEDCIEVRCGRRGDRVEIAVADRGPGVPKAERERIFERFGRGAAAAHTRAPGLGLGLALSRETARLMGGDINVAPRPGGGSVFTLELPAGPIAATAPLTATAAAAEVAEAVQVAGAAQEDRRALRARG